MDELVDRNRHFAQTDFRAGLTMRPSLATIVISCFDPRVDPAVVLGAEQGEIGVLRNVGGRVTPHTIEELVMLSAVGRAVGSGIGAGWEVVVLQHTQCGITLIQDRSDLLAPYFQAASASVSVGDPRAAVAHDVAVLRTEPRLAGAAVSGLVYDVTTGLVETVAKSSED
ncbi:carbonic anhydrase [Streptomyces sp. NPDC026672]|uniref:carbonic anhydrase n=1 Tax=unclassified Streptomyces TaxID=2593676 RepID=UPI00340DA5A0